MKVLMTTDNIGGVWTYSLDLAAALAPMGVQVELAVMGRPLDHGQRAQLCRLNIRAYAQPCKLEWMADPWQDVKDAGQWLLELNHVLQPDLVHLNGYAHGSLPWSSPVIIVGHSCVLSWHQAVRRCAAGPQWHIYADHVRRGIRAATAIVAPSAAMLSELRRLYAPLPFHQVIHNGRDGTAFRPGSKEPLVFAAGRLWDEAKNLHMLAHAMEGSGIRVCIAGEGPTWPNVQCPGPLMPEKIADWMSRATIYALPARYEPFGLSVLEAAMSGCALVLGDIPSLREIWGDSALYVSPDDESSLRKIIQDLLADPRQLQDLSRRSLARANRYSSCAMAHRYLRLYQRLLAGRQGSRAASLARTIT